MKTSLLRKHFTKLGYLLAVLLTTTNLFAQSPYSIAPKWFFGMEAGMDFTGGVPVVMNGNPSGLAGSGQEESSTMCDPSGNVIFYTDSYTLYDGNNNAVQKINGGTSSTNSSVCFPDPASPTTDFYLVTANQDPGGGGLYISTANLGVYYYKIHKTGPGTISVTSGPNLLASNNQVTEQLCAGTDSNGGYWVVTHQLTGNQIWSWNFTASGVGALQASSVAGTETNTAYNGSMKIDRCQDKIATISKSNNVYVYRWNQKTGMVTSLLTSTTVPTFGYGCEFSPNGNLLYYSDLTGHSLYQLDLTTNVVTTLATNSSNTGGGVNEIGTLQMGPDNKIYLSDVNYFVQPNYVGVISNPDVSGAGCGYNGNGFTLNNSVGNYPTTYRGIANEAWINPTLTLDTTGNCKTLKFTYDFVTYFGNSVSVTANSEQWDFGDGNTGTGANPSHTYASGGTYNIVLKVTDATCGKVWTAKRAILVNSCPTSCTNAVAPTSTNADTTICANAAGNMVLKAVGGSGAQLEWYTAGCGGTSIGTGNNLSIPFPTVNTTYFVRWLSTGACTNSSCVQVTVTVKALPTDPTTASVDRNNFCANDAGNIKLSFTGGTGDSLVWYSGSCGGTKIGKGNNLTIASPTAASTDYFARWESGACTASNCVPVNVATVAAPTPSISGVSSSCASVTSVAFSTTDNSGAGNTYLWSSTGGITISSATNTAGITADIGTTAGVVQVTETAGTCSTTVSQAVSITPATSNATVGADKNICVNSYNLNGNDPAVGRGQWTVYNGSGTFSPDANTYNATVSGLSNGANTFIWTITGACGVNHDTIALTVGVDGLIVNASTSSDTLCYGSSKNISANVSGTGSGNYTYVWTSSDHSFSSSTTNSTTAVNPEGEVTSYYLTVIDNKNTGCNAGDTVVVYAIPNQELIVPNLVTPNGDHKNDYLQIMDLNEKQILPGSQIEVSNRWGERVYNSSSYDNTFSGENLSDGIYYYYIKSGCGNKTYKGWLQVLH